MKPRHLKVLQAWDYLPDDALIEGDVVDLLLGRSRASRFRDIKAGLLPKPVKVGSSARYRAGDVRAALRKYAGN